MKNSKSILGLITLTFGFYSQISAQQKILMVVTNNKQVQASIAGKDTVAAGGYELSEVSEAYYVFKASGFIMDFMSPKGGVTYFEPEENLSDINKSFIANAEVMRKLENTLSPSEVNPKEYSAIYFAGGKTMWDFPNTKELGELAIEIHEANGVVGAVCHGPAALVNAKLPDGTYFIEGKRISSFTDLEEKLFSKTVKFLPFLLQEQLTSMGADFQEMPPLFNQVVVDGRLVTGQNPLSTYSVANKMVKLLGKEKVERKWTDLAYTLEVIKLLVIADKKEAEHFMKTHSNTCELKRDLLQDYSNYAFEGHLGDMAKNKGLELLKFSVEAFPESPKSHEFLAQAYHSLDKDELALNHLQKALKIEPNSPSALHLLEEVDK